MAVTEDNGVKGVQINVQETGIGDNALALSGIKEDGSAIDLAMDGPAMFTDQAKGAGDRVFTDNGEGALISHILSPQVGKGLEDN